MILETRTRILRILQILQTETDAEHPITIVEIGRLLKDRWNLDAYRITVQQDIEAMIAPGYPIAVVRSTQNRYYIRERLFSLPELKLLIDAVESGKFITRKKSRILADKLTTLANIHDAGALKRNISLADRVKTENEAGYEILDALNDAINAGVKVSFRYFEYSGTKRRKLKNGGEPYIAASNNVIKVNNAFERLGAVFIITSAISMFLQVKDLTDIRDFLSDFRISSNKYTSQIKGNINNDSCCRTVAFGIIVSIFSYGVA